MTKSPKRRAKGEPDVVLFSVRISGSLHRFLKAYAAIKNLKLRDVVEDWLYRGLEEEMRKDTAPRSLTLDDLRSTRLKGGTNQ